MSLEESENALKDKLMNILEEELSALKLKEASKSDENENLIDDHSDEREEAVDIKENFSPSDDKTAGILREIDSDLKEIENERNEALIPPSESAAREILRQTSYQHQEIDNDVNEIEYERNEASIPPSESAAKTILRQTSYQHQEIDNDVNEIEYERNEASIPPSESAAKEILRQASYQHQEFPQRGVYSPKNAEKLMQDLCVQDKMCMNNSETFIPPSDALADKILQRAEFYFQDYNLFKNSFLLNHIQRNKRGFVSLKLIASLRKIKALTKDLRVIAYSIRRSKILELNPENTKLRRIEIVPKIEDTSFGKTLMVFNLPSQNLSRVYLGELFNMYGCVVTAEVYDIHSHECNAYHERCLYFHRKIVSKIYGTVEFEDYDQVVNVLKDQGGHPPKESEMIAVPLMPQIYKKEIRYLQFLDAFNPNRRRGYERVKSRDDLRPVKDEMPISREPVRYGMMNAGSYTYRRGYFRRPYGARRPFMPGSGKNDSDSQTASDYNGNFPKKWRESRPPRPNNAYNVDRPYQNRK